MPTLGRKRQFSDEERRLRHNQRSLKWHTANRENNLVTQARYRAKKKGIAFNLAPEDLQGRVKFCERTGIALTRNIGRRGPGPFSPTLDRIDPSKGYTKENIQIVCNGYNSLKGSGTSEDALLIAQKVVEQADVGLVGRWQQKPHRSLRFVETHPLGERAKESWAGPRLMGSQYPDW